MSPSSRSTSQQVQFGSFGGVDVLEDVDAAEGSELHLLAGGSR
ncbi:hypothetical protein [Clavibacter michiganensis]|nr:hypothetical protein [Clavibacter michiganensis]